MSHLSTIPIVVFFIPTSHLWVFCLLIIIFSLILIPNLLSIGELLFEEKKSNLKDENGTYLEGKHTKQTHSKSPQNNIWSH